MCWNLISIYKDLIAEKDSKYGCEKIVIKRFLSVIIFCLVTLFLIRSVGTFDDSVKILIAASSANTRSHTDGMNR